MSALGHKQPFRAILAECLLPGLNRTFPSQWIDDISSLFPVCPLVPKPDVQIQVNPLKLRSAYGHKRTVMHVVCDDTFCVIATWQSVLAMVCFMIAKKIAYVTDGSLP